MRRKYAEIDIEVSERWSEQKKIKYERKDFSLERNGRNSYKNSVTADQLKFKSMNRSSRIVTSCDFAPFLNQ